MVVLPAILGATAVRLAMAVLGADMVTVVMVEEGIPAMVAHRR